MNAGWGRRRRGSRKVKLKAFLCTLQCLCKIDFFRFDYQALLHDKYKFIYSCTSMYLYINVFVNI